MSRYRGSIGINRGSVEGAPGVYSVVVDEIEVSGEIRNIGARWQNAGMRDSLAARHVLSIVTPEYSDIDFTEVVYIVWKGKKWSVISIEYKRPRIELTLGGLYNG